MEHHAYVRKVTINWDREKGGERTATTMRPYLYFHAILEDTVSSLGVSRLGRAESGVNTLILVSKI